MLAINRMKLEEHKWVVVKILLIVAGILTSAIPAAEGESPPTIVVTVIPFVFCLLFLPFYIKACQRTPIVSTKELWNSYPFSPFTEPMAFYHLAAWVCVCSGIALFVRNVFQTGAYEVSVAWFLLSGGAGCFIALCLVKKSFKEVSNAGEHRGAVDAAARPD